MWQVVATAEEVRLRSPARRLTAQARSFAAV